MDDRMPLPSAAHMTIARKCEILRFLLEYEPGQPNWFKVWAWTSSHCLAVRRTKYEEDWERVLRLIEKECEIWADERDGIKTPRRSYGAPSEYDRLMNRWAPIHRRRAEAYDRYCNGSESEDGRICMDGIDPIDQSDGDEQERVEGERVEGEQQKQHHNYHVGGPSASRSPAVEPQSSTGELERSSFTIAIESASEPGSDARELPNHQRVEKRSRSDEDVAQSLDEAALEDKLPARRRRKRSRGWSPASSALYVDGDAHAKGTSSDETRNKRPASSDASASEVPRFQSQPKPNGDSEAEAGVILDKIVDSIPTDRAEASIVQAHRPVSSTASTVTDQDSQARNAVEGSASSLHVDGDLLAGASASNRRVECPSEKFEDSNNTITASIPNVKRQTPPSLPLDGAANRPVAQIFPSTQGREHEEDDDRRDLPTNDNKITLEPSKQASACTLVTLAAATAVAEDARIARIEAQLASTTSQVTDIKSALATLTQTLHQRLDGPSLRQLGKRPDVSDSLPSKVQMAAAETSPMVMGDHHRDLAAGLMQHAAQSIMNAGKMLEIGAFLLQGRLSSTSEDAK